MTDSTEHPPIVEFIEARLAEDEDVAVGAMRGPQRSGWSEDYGQEFIVVVGVRDGVPDCVVRSTDESRHIARHDPARVLRQVKTLRATLRAIEDRDHEDWNRLWLMTIADFWADHPDYNPAWSAADSEGGKP